MEDDNDKTLAHSTSMHSSATGMPGAFQGSINVLPPGTRLAEFEIVGLIGEGGFGIVYLAYDHSLGRQVALKEYMPSGLVSRTRTMYVTVKSQHHADTFTAGLRSFVNEARLLAQFDAPSLVKVYRFWEANGTAYMVMPYYEGITLKQAFKERRIVPDETWIRVFLASLFDAVETIHQVQCYHRDIAPDNILLLKDGRPLLLDFGAARRVIGDLTQGPTVIVKPGFAPIEQYADIPGLRQGAWTDVYALAAVVYYLITGKAPPPAVARIINDEMPPARVAGHGRYSDAFLAVIDHALAVKPEHRIQTVAEMRDALELDDAMSQTLRPETWVRQTTAHRPSYPGADAKPASTGWRAAGVAAASNAPDTQKTAAPLPPLPDDWMRPMTTERRWVDEPPRRRGWPAWLGLALILSTGIAGGVYWGMKHWQPETPAVAASEQSAPPSADTAASMPPVAASAAQESQKEQAAPQEEAPAAPVTQQHQPATPASAQEPAAPAEHAPELGPAVALAAPANPASGAKETQAAPAARVSAEEELWRMALASGKPGGYQAYLKEYPRGRYASAARLKLDRMQANAAKPAPSSPEPAPAPSAEDALWKTAVAINQVPGYESYLSKYPNGRYVAAARARLAAIMPAAPAPQQKEKEQKEKEPKEDNAARDKLALAKPSEPDAATAGPTAPETAKPAPEAPPAATGSERTIRLPDQTMIGNFTVDPISGVVSGTGRIIWNNGEQFRGTMVRGVKQGKGEFTWKNGQRYSGDWSHNMPNGTGTFIFTNGDRYEGQVKDGMPNGQGFTLFRNGDAYRGAWVNGKSHGQGRYTWANGGYWEGEFRNDSRTENGKMVFAQGATGAAQSGSGHAAGAERQAGRP